MNFVSIVTTVTLVLSSIVLKAKNPEQCALNKFIGDWYGQLEYHGGTVFLAHLQIQKVKGCQLEGVINWPDYFNSQTKVTGSMVGDHIELKEVALNRGIFMDLNKSTFSLKPDDNGALEGTAFVDGENVASFDFNSANSLSESEFEQISGAYSTSAEIYGYANVVERSDQSFEKIYSEYIETNGDGSLPFGIEVDGLAYFENLEIPLRFLISPLGQLYMEMRLQNLEMIMVKTDSLSWTYDPMKDQVSLSEGNSTNDYMRVFSGGLHSLDTVDVNRISVFEANVNGNSVYRVLYSDELSIPQKAFYIDQETHLLIREETSEKIIHYENYDKILGFWLPASMTQYEVHNKVGKFRFDEYRKVDHIDESVFEIPERLKNKIAKPPTVKSSWADEAKLAFDSQNYSQSIELYTNAIEQNPTDEGLYYRRGVARYLTEDNYGAMADFQRAIDLNSTVGDYYNRRGLVKYRFADFQSAKTDFVLAQKMDTTLAVALMNAAFADYQLSEFDSAVFHLNKAIEIDPNNGQFYLNRGAIHVEQQNNNLAILDYEKCIELEYGELADLNNRIGVAYSNQEEYESSIDYFKRAISEDENNVTAIENLGDAYYFSEYYEEALGQYKLVLSSDSLNDDLLNSIALCYYFLHGYETAIDYHDRSIKLNTKNPNYFDNRAYTFIEMMKYQEAIEDFTKSIELYSEDAEVYYQRGMLHEIQHDQFDACRDYKAASELGHEEASQLLANRCK